MVGHGAGDKTQRKLSRTDTPISSTAFIHSEGSF